MCSLGDRIWSDNVIMCHNLTITPTFGRCLLSSALYVNTEQLGPYLYSSDLTPNHDDQVLPIQICIDIALLQCANTQFACYVLQLNRPI